VCQQVPPEWNWAGLKKSDLTLPRQLKQVDYTTIHVGKAHFAPFKHEGEDPLNLGFDVNVAGSAIGAPTRTVGRRLEVIGQSRCGYRRGQGIGFLRRPAHRSDW
jgi:hypothetical protein